MDRNSEKITLLGREVELAERNADDVFAFLSYIENTEKDVVNITYINAYVICDALKPYISGLWFLKRWYYQKIYTKRNLLRKCTISKLSELAKLVGTLEGVETDEKKTDNESPEK